MPQDKSLFQQAAEDEDKKRHVPIFNRDILLQAAEDEQFRRDQSEHLDFPSFARSNLFDNDVGTIEKSLNYAGDFSHSFFEGAKEGINELADFVDWVGDEGSEVMRGLGAENFDVPDIPTRFEEINEPLTVAGSVGHVVGQIAPALIPGTQIAKASKAQQFGQMIGRVSNMSKANVAKMGVLFSEAAAGATTVNLAFDADDPNLSNLIESYPALSNPISAALAKDPSDPQWVKVLKTGVEEAGLTPIFSVVFKAIARGIKPKRLKEIEAERVVPDEVTGEGTVLRPSIVEEADQLAKEGVTIKPDTPEDAKDIYSLYGEAEEEFVKELPESVFATKRERLASKMISRDKLWQSFNRSFLGLDVEPATVKRFLEGKVKAKDEVLQGKSIAHTPAAMAKMFTRNKYNMTQAWTGMSDVAPGIPNAIDSSYASFKNIPGLNKGFLKIAEGVGKPKEQMDFLIYLQAKDAATVKKTIGIDNPLLGQDDFIKRMESNPKVIEAAREMGMLDRAFLDLQLNAGTISKTDYQNMVKAHTNPDTGQYLFAPIPIQPTRPTKGATGSTFSIGRTGNVGFKLKDPLKARLEYYSKGTSLAFNNMLKQSVYTTLRNAAKSSDEALVSLSKEVAQPVVSLTSKEKAAVKEVLKARLKELILKADEEDILLLGQLSTDDVGKMSFKELLDKAGGFGTIDTSQGAFDLVKFRGEPELWKIKDIGLREMLEDIGIRSLKAQEDAVTGIGKKSFEFLKKSNRLFSKAISLTPKLGLRNMMRAEMTATIGSPFTHIPVLSSLSKVKDVFMSGPRHAELTMNGLGGGTLNDAIGKQIADWSPANDVERILKSSWESQLKTRTKSGVQWWHDTLGKAEMLQRAAVANAARKAGADPQTQALMGAQVLTDFFARPGNKTVQNAGDIIMFFNPTLAGLDNMFKTVRYNWRKTVPLVLAGGYALHSYTEMMEEVYPEEYRNFAKDLGPLYIPIPTAADGEDSVTEFMIKFAAGEARREDAPTLNKGAPFFYYAGAHEMMPMMYMVSQLAETYEEEDWTPIARGFQRSFQALAPDLFGITALKPLADAASGKNNFGTEIVPFSAKGDPEAFGANTGEAAQYIASVLKDTPVETSPYMIDFIVNAYTPGLLGILKNTADYAAVSVGDFPEKPTTDFRGKAQSANPILFAKEDFISAFSPSQNQMKQLTQTWFEISKEVQELRRAKERLTGKGLIDILVKRRSGFSDEDKAIIDVSPYARRVMAVLAGLERERSRIIKGSLSRTLTAEEKRDRLAELNVKERRFTNEELERILGGGNDRLIEYIEGKLM